MRIAFKIAIILLPMSVFSQGLVEDQNPNYQKSMQKYMDQDNSEVLKQGTTVQNTYEAIDELGLGKKLRHVRRMQRMDNRHELRMARAQRRNIHQNFINPYAPQPFFGGFRGPRWGFRPNVFLGGTIHNRRPFVRPHWGMNLGYGWGF